MGTALEDQGESGTCRLTADTKSHGLPDVLTCPAWLRRKEEKIEKRRTSDAMLRNPGEKIKR